MRIKILLDHEQALFFSQSVDICKREKIPTYMSGGIRQRLKLALVLHILPQELKGKIRDHSRFAEAYQYKDFPRSFPLGQLTCEYGHLFSLLIAWVSLVATIKERPLYLQTIFTDLELLFSNDPR